MAHPDHSAELKRLSRMIGQLEGIKRMIEEGEYCPNILIQTKAVASAIRSLETALLEKHIQHCVRSALENKRQDANSKLSELVDIFKKRLK